MTHSMRNAKRELPESAAWEILGRADHGVLSTFGPDGYPYGVPLNHVLVGRDLYLHCAPEGHKLENQAHLDRVSYCAITEARVEPRAFSTIYESAIAFGRAVLVTDETEMLVALRALNARHAQGLEAEGEAVIRKWTGRVAVVKITVERLTAKARRAKFTEESP